jgi:hypothetical protein
MAAIHIYGYWRDIHIIHSPYCYYESHILFINNLEFNSYILYNESTKNSIKLKGSCGRIAWTS